MLGRHLQREGWCWPPEQTPGLASVKRQAQWAYAMAVHGGGFVRVCHREACLAKGCFLYASLGLRARRFRESERRFVPTERGEPAPRLAVCVARSHWPMCCVVSSHADGELHGVERGRACMDGVQGNGTA